jgi:hypothetical protein
MEPRVIDLPVMMNQQVSESCHQSQARGEVFVDQGMIGEQFETAGIVIGDLLEELCRCMQADIDGCLRGYDQPETGHVKLVLVRNEISDGKASELPEPGNRFINVLESGVYLFNIQWH